MVDKKPLFMSPEHVQMLNEHMARVPAIRDACAKLPRDVYIVQRLVDEEGGPDVWWQITYSRRNGSHLALGKPSAPVSAVLEVGYWASLELTEAAMRGRAPLSETMESLPANPRMTPELAQALAVTAEVHALCWAEGLKFDVEFPKRKQVSSGV